MGRGAGKIAHLHILQNMYETLAPQKGGNGRVLSDTS
jgi:hypothetical protein